MQVGQDLAATGTGASSGCACGETSGASFSQSHPSLKQVCTVPIFERFSTMNGAPHFGHGSAIGMCGLVVLQSGYPAQYRKVPIRPRLIAISLAQLSQYSTLLASPACCSTGERSSMKSHSG